ncbi:hypothetical protein L2E82_18266 [Cichorium intybus]|uniref:Uncharacterized protein n=1 Tax=Cichorium intybus TaxID=13427 RepID=A0ACB9F9L2_CICIN|nr:hypothetical protein L2E82_18266 [Cichorium intybus]
MLISGKIDPNFISELPKAIFHQIEPGDAWGNVWRLQSNPVNTFTIPKSSSFGKDNIEEALESMKGQDWGKPVSQ